MKIAIDLEGVLAASNVVFPKELGDRLGRHVPESFQYQWNLKEAAKYALGVEIDDDWHSDIWLGTWQRWREIPLIEPDLKITHDFFDSMKELGHEVTILTHSFSQAIEDYKAEWIRHNIGPRNIEWVSGSQRKEDYDYDLFVDDSPHNLSAMKRVGKNAICFDQPWNRGLSDEWYWRRVTTLRSVELLLRMK